MAVHVCRSGVYLPGLLLDTPPGVMDLSQWKEFDCAYRNNYAYN